LIIALSGSVLWLTVFRNDHNKLLEAELSTPYPLATLDRGSLAESAFESYIKGDYRNAMTSFNKVTNGDVSVTFYNGLSHLYAGEYDKAVILLRSTSLEGSRYHEQALWFETLALIQAERKGEAKENLERISKNSTHYKSAEALRLLEHL